MPSAREGYEKLKYMVEHGQGSEKIHIVFVEREQQERIKNQKRQTRFVLVTHDPDLCSDFQREKDRITKRVGNVSVAQSLMVRAWKDALADAEIDRIMAEVDKVESGIVS